VDSSETIEEIVGIYRKNESILPKSKKVSWIKTKSFLPLSDRSVLGDFIQVAFGLYTLKLHGLRKLEKKWNPSAQKNGNGSQDKFIDQIFFQKALNRLST